MAKKSPLPQSGLNFRENSLFSRKNALNGNSGIEDSNGELIIDPHLNTVGIIETKKSTSKRSDQIDSNGELVIKIKKSSKPPKKTTQTVI